MGTPDFAGLREAIPFSPQAVLPQQVVDRVEDCLRRNSYLALANVRCDFHEGVLTLRGCLPTYYLRQMVQSTLGSVAGIHHLVNEIEVKRGAR